MPETTAPRNAPNPKQAFGDKKPPLIQLPLIAQIHASMAHLDGDLKYGFRNWRDQPVEARTYLNAIARHVRLWEEGEEYARDTGVNNLGAVIACCAILLDAQFTGNLIDNRSKSQEACDLLHEMEATVASLKEMQVEREMQKSGKLSPKDFLAKYPELRASPPPSPEITPAVDNNGPHF